MTSIAVVALGKASWERSMQAAAEVWDRLLRATAALDTARIPYAVVGGNAVATWVGRVNKKATRLTQDVDLLLSRGDLEAAKVVLTPVGFIYHETFGVHMFVDGPQGGATEAVHILFAGEKVEPRYAAPTPDLTESERGEHFQVVSLEALVRMKLTSFRRKDQVHIQDMIGVGLIDASWPGRFPPELAARLQELIDDPNG